MGSAVSAVGGLVGGLFGSAGQAMSPTVGTAVNPAANAAIQNAINQAQSNYESGINEQTNADNYLSAANQQITGAGTNAINQAQLGVNNANLVNQGIGSNVNSSIGLLGQTAQGQGAAQQAAMAQLQAGTNQAIANQSAMANSGNLSQMIGGQRTAMMDAATIQQQAANQAAALQANMAATAQGQYAGAAQQQASQAATNAALQQQQTAAQQNQATQLTNIGNIYSGQALGYGNQAASELGSAAGAATSQQSLQQQALAQQAQIQGAATGGLLNAAGGIGLGLALAPAAPAAAAAAPESGEFVSSVLPSGLSLGGPGSDEDTKTNINYASGPQAGQPYSSKLYAYNDNRQMAPTTPIPGVASLLDVSSDKEQKKDLTDDKNKIKSFLDALDPVSFEYKSSDGQLGRTPGEHLGIIAQEVEKAPHGKSMVMDTKEGKVINGPAAIGTLLAAAADSNRRLSDLEAYLKARKNKGKK